MRSTAASLPPALTLILALIGRHGCGCENYWRSGGSPAPPEAGQFNGTLYGACRVRPSTRLSEGQPKVYGRALFRQDGPQAPVQVRLRLRGFPAADGEPRGVHLHQYGDLSDGCDAAGGHYNPHGHAHPAHPGDLGNFSPRGGRVWERRSAGGGATLFGALTVLGRALVVHERRDDLGRGGDAGSLLHGNAGPRLACCVIGIASPKLWDKDLPRRPGTSSGPRRKSRSSS